MSEFPAFNLDDPNLPKSIKQAALTSGDYPYNEKIDEEQYQTELYSAYLQLALLQEHVVGHGTRIVIVFEGRDAAGKGGAIRTYLQNLNPRVAFGVALPKPSDREANQWYFQRYVDWMPAKGEQVLFDRSWYNRACVEPVMGFCTPEETDTFFREVPRFEEMLVDDGIHLFKFWLAIGREMQIKRFHDRRHDPLKRWKLSPVDLKAIEKFDDYSAARDRILRESSSPHAPWTVVLGNDKQRERLAVIRSVLHGLDYEGKDARQIGPVDEKIVYGAEAFLKRNAGD